jgi:hypothetical protein
MALPPLHPPPRIDDQILYRWLYELWRKTGEDTATAPLSVSGQSATVANAIQPGSPVGTVSAPAGTFYTDSVTGTQYFKQAGDDENGWVVIS